MKKFGIFLAALSFSTLALAAAQTPMIGVTNQIVKHDSITIGGITLAQPGFVVIHAENSDGNVMLTPDLGAKYLSKGRHQNVEIKLDPKLLKKYGYVEGSEKTAFIMLHVDANDDQKYEFPNGPDHPVKVDGQVVVKQLQLLTQKPNQM